MICRTKKKGLLRSSLDWALDKIKEIFYIIYFINIFFHSKTKNRSG